MKTRTAALRAGLAVVSVWLLAGLACSAVQGPTPEPTAFLHPTAILPKPTAKPAEPTQTSKSTAAPNVTQPPADTPAPGNTPDAAAPFTLAAKPYQHASGAFSLSVPEGWTVEERSNGVYVDAPDSVATIDVSFIDAGVELTDDEFARFIEANETNWFGSFTDYRQTSYEPQKDGSIGVWKSLSLKSAPQMVFSYYWREGVILYEQDFWVEQDLFDQYEPGLVDVANSMQTDPASAATDQKYAATYTFTDPVNNLFAFETPYGWTYTYDQQDHATLDRFTAPDERTFVENISYDRGVKLSAADARSLALEMLKEQYQAADLEVTDETTQDDGSIRLIWKSASQGVDGESFYETRGTTFLMISWIVTSDYYQVYESVWTALLDSYSVPK